jgi:hypothetical protein
MLPLARTCGHPGCAKKSTVQVFNSRNASLGQYCTAHGKQKLKEIEQSERNAEW